MKTQELTGALLDYWVARAQGRDVEIIDQGENPVSPRYYASLKPTGKVWWPSTHWVQGGPIIDDAHIELLYFGTKGHPGNPWEAQIGVDTHYIDQGAGEATRGPTALVAAMRAYVVSKFGDEVEDMGIDGMSESPAADTTTGGGNYMFEFRSRGDTTWYGSPHPPRPLEEAIELVSRMNAEDKTIVYRYVPWDGK